MAFLFTLIIIGYIIGRLNIVQPSAAGMLSKLENNVFVPALILSTFMQNFTLDRITSAWQYLLCGLAVILISIPVAYLGANICSKDPYIKKINI